jgi:hypothetical protein
MNLLLTGHPRSGTWLLQRLCDRHPDVRVTYEFGLYRTINVPILLYTLNLLGRGWATRLRPVLSDEPDLGPHENLWRSTLFKTRFLVRMLRRAPALVQPADIEAVLRELFPRARIVGDKYPNAVFNLGAYAKRNDMRTVVIYRDVRDVVASYIDLLQAGFDRAPVFGTLDSPEAIAASWVRAIDMMQRHQEDVLCLRYEALVADPAPALRRLGAWLGVDPAGFPRAMIRSDRVGTYAERLPASDLARIVDIAGPTLDELGYVR